ncbi:MAG: cupin domain-containing protein [Pseudazoarcus pumilus]|nr:cupin domain-containing protein [Pseudazoarcus pumilus]
MRVVIAGMLALLATTTANAQPQAAAPAAIESEVLARSTQSWDGSTLPNYPRALPEISILRIRIPPGTALPMHKHPVINAGVLLSGQLTVVTEDGKTLHLQAGEAIIELVNKWHYGRNDGDTTAEIVVFYAGVGGLPITEKQ